MVTRNRYRNYDHKYNYKYLNEFIATYPHRRVDNMRRSRIVVTDKIGILNELIESSPVTKIEVDYNAGC